MLIPEPVYVEGVSGNIDVEVRANYNIEWYDCTGDMSDENYHSAIWIPVKKK